MTPEFMIVYIVAGIHTMFLVLLFAGRRSPPPPLLMPVVFLAWPALVPTLGLLACIDWISKRRRR